MLKNISISISLVFISALILGAMILSYYQIDRIPYGFHVDEFSGSVDIGCMASEGIDAHGAAHPLFSNLNYGTPKPPTYIYPGIWWSKLFGYSVPSLRKLSVTVHWIGIAGLFLLAYSFFGIRFALITSLVACLSPWTWNLSRVAFESLFSSTFIIWGMYFFFKDSKTLSVICSALFFVAAIYSYPPFRLQTPLMLVTLLIYAQLKKPWGLKQWFFFSTTIILPLIPLIQKTVSGEIQQRFNSISIFSKEYLNSIHSTGSFKDLVSIFLNNYFLHFKWDFLALTGDPSYVHSTRHFGILSWLDMAALLAFFMFVFLLAFNHFRKISPFISHTNFIIFLIINILIGVIPAGLTNSELPNSLRITGAWPFVCMFSGFFLWQACELFWGFWVATSMTAVFFAFFFFNVYFNAFPQEGKGMFGYWTLDEADQIKNDQDWIKFLVHYQHQDYNARYFLMQYRHVSCTESKNMWEGMGAYLRSRGIN